MTHSHATRRALVGGLVLCTVACAVAGFILRHELAGIVLLAAGFPVAVCAWLALGAPVRRRDKLGAFGPRA
ncbi:MAG TPA: hypothetical protein VMT74_07590 [Gaiellaceae bacterium]|nr:hypothetical protein [Gaiellaceae bacterium]